MFLPELEKSHLVMKRMKKKKICGLLYPGGLITGMKNLFQIWWAYNRGGLQPGFYGISRECSTNVPRTHIFPVDKACNFIKKETLVQVFSCEFCEISNNTFFTEHPWTTASTKKIDLWLNALIFQRRPSIKMFLFCSHLKFEISHI